MFDEDHVCETGLAMAWDTMSDEFLYDRARPWRYPTGNEWLLYQDCHMRAEQVAALTQRNAELEEQNKALREDKAYEREVEAHVKTMAERDRWIDRCYGEEQAKLAAWEERDAEKARSDRMKNERDTSEIHYETMVEAMHEQKARADKAEVKWEWMLNHNRPVCEELDRQFARRTTPSQSGGE